MDGQNYKNEAQRKMISLEIGYSDREIAVHRLHPSLDTRTGRVSYMA